MEPKVITEMLRQIEAAERGPEHPRRLARTAIAKWRSNAQVQRLPVSNQHDDRGGQRLDIATILAHDHHTARLGRK